MLESLHIHLIDLILTCHGVVGPVEIDGGNVDLWMDLRRGMNCRITPYKQQHVDKIPPF